MKFLVDAQLPPALAEWFRAKGYEAAGVRDIGLRDADDAVIWARAASDGAILVTKDDDFSRTASTRVVAPRILWVRTGNTTNRSLIARFESCWPELRKHLLSSVRVIEFR